MGRGCQRVVIYGLGLNLSCQLWGESRRKVERMDLSRLEGEWDEEEEIAGLFCCLYSPCLGVCGRVLVLSSVLIGGSVEMKGREAPA